MPLGPFWLNRWLVPYIVAVFYLLFYFHPGLRALFVRFLGWLDRRSEHVSLDYLGEDFFSKGLRMEADLRYVLFSVLGTLGLLLGFEVATGWMMQSYGEALWFSSLTSGFLNPISEEVLSKGILLNLFAFSAYYLKLTGRKKYSLYLLGITVTSLTFTISHINLGLMQFSARFSSSVLFCVVYLLSDRNLLPPIVTHAAWNWYLIGKGAIVW